MTSDGTNDIIVGKNNCNIEIHSFDMETLEPILIYSANVGGSVTGLDIGNISLPTVPDIIISTYSGKILSLID